MLLDPVIEYSRLNEMGRTVRTVVIGGYVYRGSALPWFAGKYLFGDWSSSFAIPDGTIFVAEEGPTGEWEYSEVGIETENARINHFSACFWPGHRWRNLRADLPSCRPERTYRPCF